MIPAANQPTDPIRDALAAAGFTTPGDYAPEKPLYRIRRSGRSREEEKVLSLTLVERDGVLYWEDEDVADAPSRGFRAWTGAGFAGDVKQRFLVEASKPMDPSQVAELLANLDKRFNKWQDAETGFGLKAWDGSALQPIAKPAGKSLLIVHGTFSNASSVFAEFAATPKGRDLLKAAQKAYKNVLAFDHPTLAVSPVLNALDLARALAKLPDGVDIISHSRGGLVTRWWLEAFSGNAPANRRAMLVGSPLNGTSLASPPSLRNAMSFISNLNKVLATGAQAVSPVAPFLTVFAAIFRIAGSLSGAVSKTPVIDAAIAMVPGLNAMSRTSTNFELDRLRIAGPQSYSFVTSNFEPKDPGWRFWEVFVNLKDRVKDAVTDAVFQESNDLVVDTASMTDTHAGYKPAKESLLDFGTTPNVHHTNYFRQPETLDFIRTTFQF